MDASGLENESIYLSTFRNARELEELAVTAFIETTQHLTLPQILVSGTTIA
jgi:hypothetical protein